MPQKYFAAEQFKDPGLELSLLAALKNAPDLYWTLTDQAHLAASVFAEHRSLYDELAQAIERDAPLPEIEGQPAADPPAVTRTLVDLYARRLLADLHQEALESLHAQTPAAELLVQLEDRLAGIYRDRRDLHDGRLLWAADRLTDVLELAAARRVAWEETGKAATGLPTGIGLLDGVLGGLNPGLTILAGSPGVGKTTLALQIAAAAIAEAPVVYVTFENSTDSLVLKALAARAGVSLAHVQRGWAELGPLHHAAERWKPIAARLAFIDGNSRLTVSQVRARVRQVMSRMKADRCLVIVDYLQLWAKVAADYRAFATVRERVEGLGAELRELAMDLGAPVLALASQNRSQGDYGSGKGAAALDSLKESGDLEYMADVVLFLTLSKDRMAVNPARAVDLTVAKNRYGDTGKIDLIFRADLSTMREEARTWEPSHV